MTEIDFYTHVEDRQRVACQLVLKARERNLKVLILVDDEDQLRRLDDYLWSFQAQSFVPHCRMDDPLAADTPVLLAVDTENACPHTELLVNLRNTTPPGFARFQRLLEVVSTDAQDRALARERFKFYRDRGYALRTHDLGATRATPAAR